MLQLFQYKEILQKSADQLSPAILSNYIYELVKNFNSFYQNNTIINDQDLGIQSFRLELSYLTAKTIQKSLKLLGINVVHRM